MEAAFLLAAPALLRGPSTRVSATPAGGAASAFVGAGGTSRPFPSIASSWAAASLHSPLLARDGVYGDSVRHRSPSPNPAFILFF